MKPVRDEAVHTLLQELGTPAATAAAASKMPPSGANLPRVLIVDDDPASVTVAARFIERLGCAVDVTTEGARVLPMLHSRRYAAVCLDITLADMNGCDITRQWRACESAVPRTPFIAMTAHTTREDRDRFLVAGFDDHLAKPLRLDALQAALDRLIPELRRTRLQSQ